MISDRQIDRPFEWYFITHRNLSVSRHAITNEVRQKVMRRNDYCVI